MLSVQWSRKLFLAFAALLDILSPCQTFFPVDEQHISGHSCFSCRTFHLYWTPLVKMSGKVWALCRTSAEVCRTCTAYFAITGLYNIHVVHCHDIKRLVLVCKCVISENILLYLFSLHSAPCVGIIPYSFAFSGILTMIIVRTLRRDIAKYNKMDDEVF